MSTIATINVSSSDSNSSDEEGPTPAKRSRVNESSSDSNSSDEEQSDANLSFKEKVQGILETLSGAAPGQFAVAGKLNAPMINIAIKVNEILLYNSFGTDCDALILSFCRIQREFFTFRCTMARQTELSNFLSNHLMAEDKKLLWTHRCEIRGS